MINSSLTFYKHFTVEFIIKILFTYINVKVPAVKCLISAVKCSNISMKCKFGQFSPNFP
jgi:hypothetical protein